MTETTVTVDGEERRLTDNPSMRTVKAVQKMQMDALREHLDDETLENFQTLGEDEIMERVMDNGGFDALQEMMWSQGLLETVQTISLALDEAFTEEDAEGLGAKDFITLREEANEVLGGDVNDFMERLGVGTNLNQQEMERRMQKAIEDES